MSTLYFWDLKLLGSPHYLDTGTTKDRVFIEVYCKGFKQFFNATLKFNAHTDLEGNELVPETLQKKYVERQLKLHNR